MAYNFKEIEKKWQTKWEKQGTFNVRGCGFHGGGRTKTAGDR